MNFEFFIAKRVHFSPSGAKRFSKLAINIAVGGIAVGVAVMLLAVAIVVGFKREVRSKVIGFGSHIQVASTFDKNTFEPTAISVDTFLYDKLCGLSHVSSVQKVATQPGIVSVDGNFQGVVFKGVDDDYNWDFFKANLVCGEFLSMHDSTASKQVLVSRKIADMLGIGVGDKFISYFILDGKVRARSFEVKGIYSTGFVDYDKLFIVCDLNQIRKLRGWSAKECGGLELLVKDYEDIDYGYQEAFSVVGNRFDEGGASYSMRTIKQLNPHIFSWLDLLDLNVVIIMILMSAVAGFTIVSGVLILILEKFNMIGVMKAMGATDWNIRKVFLYMAIFLVAKGLVLGNVIALILCFVQKRYSLIPLDAEVYYMDSVPISLTIPSFLAVNIITLVVLTLVVLIPTYIITRISPVRSLRFE